MLRGKQVLPEGNARLGSRNMKACPTQTCVMDMGLGLLSCQLLPQGTSDSIPMCWGVESRSCCQGTAGQRWACEGDCHPAAHGMPHCICHLGSACPGDLNMQKRNNLRFYMWNLFGGLHYLTLLHQLISGEIQYGLLHLLRAVSELAWRPKSINIT